MECLPSDYLLPVTYKNLISIQFLPNLMCYLAGEFSKYWRKMRAPRIAPKLEN